MKKGLQIFDISQLENINLSEYDFVVLGTETCIFKVKFEKTGGYFLDIQDIFKLRNLLSGKKLVYVTSLLPEYVRKEYFKFLKILIEILGIDNIEITVNDWGIYKWLKDNKLIGSIKLNIGTDLYYHVKDPYAVYYKNRFKYISIDKQFYEKFFRKKGFNGYLEIYCPLQGIQVKNLTYPISLYYPFVQYSLTRSCPWNLKKSGEKVSKLVLRCGGCPTNYYNVIVSQILKWKNLNFKTRYIPNAQYYSIENMHSLEKINKFLQIDRVVYNYYLIVNKQYG